MKGRFSLAFSIALSLSTVYCAVFFKCYRESGTEMDIWFYITSLITIAISLIQFAAANSGRGVKFIKFRFLLIFVIIGSAIYSLRYDSLQEGKLQASCAPISASEIISYFMRMIRYLSLFVVNGCILAVEIWCGKKILDRVKTRNFDKLDAVYQYIGNPKFRLRDFYKDYKQEITTKPFSKQDMVCVKDVSMEKVPEVKLDLKEEDEISCVICFGEFEQGEEMLVLPICGHIYHDECIGEWLQKRCTCPTCRGTIRYNLLMTLHTKANKDSSVSSFSESLLQVNDGTE